MIGGEAGKLNCPVEPKLELFFGHHKRHLEIARYFT